MFLKTSFKLIVIAILFCNYIIFVHVKVTIVATKTTAGKYSPRAP